MLCQFRKVLLPRVALVENSISVTPALTKDLRSLKAGNPITSPLDGSKYVLKVEVCYAQYGVGKGIIACFF